MNEKIIGVTPRFSVEDNTLKQSCNDNYLRSMQLLGFTPIILPIGIQKNDILLELCDGFLVTGGIDMLPKFFGQENDGSEEGNEEMDLTDKVVIEYAIKKKKPLLGICRGHQVLNVFLGGTLIQDIGDSHRHGVKHNVRTVENRLINLPPTMVVNSYHHQVIDAIGKNLTGIAYSDENYCEALIHDSLPILTVQWHPERMLDDENQRAIFEKFKELVNKHSI